MRIAFIGKAGSGKTSASMYLVAKYGFKKYAFADALKEDVVNLYQLPVRMVYVDKPPHVRKALQNYGMAKRKEDPEYWIKRLNRKIVEDLNRLRDYIDFFNLKGELDIKNFIEDRIVIDDMRFLNEAEWAKKNGFYIVKLIRKGEFSAAGIDSETSKHVSEKEFEKIEPDFVIESGSYPELFKKLDELIFNLSYGYIDEKGENPEKELMKEFEIETGRRASWKGKPTKAYKEWKEKRGLGEE
ncbi:MAG: nucleoside/nucleotide kinase family protein [Candidatus Helarchaeales archaeon]